MLRQLLAVWRETRHARVAHLVRALSVAGPALDLHSKKDWDAAVSQDDPELVPSLLTHVTSGYSTVARTRLMQVAKRGPDPRVVDAILRWTQELPYRTPPRADEWWGEVRRVLARQAPPGLDLDALADDILIRHSTNYAVKTANAFRKLSPQPFEPRALTAAEEAMLAELETEHPPPAPIPEGHASLEELFEAVANDPDDDGVRQVLADVLQQQDDPRGEFIALQFARLEGGGDAKREAELLSENLGEWAGPWPPALGAVRFERGFLAGLALEKKLNKLGKLVGEPTTRTLEQLTVRPVKLNRTATRALPRLLAALPQLRDLGIVQIDHVESVRELDGRLRSVELEVGPGDLPRIVAWVPRLERLERVALHPGHNLEPHILGEVAVELNVPHISVHHHWDGGLARLIEGASPAVRTLSYGGHYHSRLRLERDQSPTFQRAVVELRGSELQLDVLAELPDGLPFTIPDPVDEVNIADWAVLPRLAEVGSHFGKVEYWGQSGTADPAPEHFEGLPTIELLHVSLLSDQRDHSALIDLLADRPEVQTLEITHSLRITRDAEGRLTQGELRSFWWDADERVETVFPHLHSLRWQGEPSSWTRTPDDAEDRYRALIERYGLSEG